MNTTISKVVWSVAALAVVIVLIIIGSEGYMSPQTASSTPVQTLPDGSTFVASTVLSCDMGKSITASFYSGTDVPGTDTTPPIPGGSAEVRLSDGRTMTLHQTISADGVRYSNGDPQVQGSETFVFWSKGNGALVLENNVEKSYIGCIRTASDTGGLSNIYSSGAEAFSIRYPAGFTADPSYAYEQFGASHTIKGVKFTIAKVLSDGTNLGSDTYISVEQIPNVTACSADMFLADRVAVDTQNLGGTLYSTAKATGAGAGNRYEETVYAIPGTNPCVAVRYFVHYSVFENYPAGSVEHYDSAGLMAQFDAMRASLVLDR